VKLKERRSILMVEDSPEDFQAMQWACASIDIALIRCENGEQAIEYLHRGGTYSEAHPPPGIVLLDLNLPRMNGREVLRSLKTSPHTKSLPVVILSSSWNPKEVEACYLEGANSFLVKPLGLKPLRDLMECVVGYWFGHVTLASPRSPEKQSAASK
jgi:CheY-like chemotaxis protein